MKKIAFFDTKPYDRESFDKLNGGFQRGLSPLVP